jgi:hypothetical protein
MWLEFRFEMSGFGSAPSYAECPGPRSPGGASCYRLVSKPEFQTETRPAVAAISELLHTVRASYACSPEYFPCHLPPVRALVAFMPAATNTPDPTTQPAPWPPSTDRRGGLARLLGLVRKLIDYGKDLAATLQARGLTDRPAGASAHFGTRDIALILSRIAVALLRADALEARLLLSAARPDPTPCPPRAPSQRAPHAARREEAEPAAQPDPRLARLPTPEQIAAEIRRRPIGAVLIDICRDLGIMADHPLWRELHPAIILHGGGFAAFFKDMCERAFGAWRSSMNALAAPPASSPPLSLEPASTGPP